jgi:outer membrane protein OmpA-like peptidoglycan-associated protein
MADLNVQRKSNNWWLWLLVAVIAIPSIYFLSNGCNSGNNGTANNDTAKADSVSSADATFSSPNGYNEWSNIDFNLPNAKYSEITDKDISVRGNDQYSVYGLGAKVLFDFDKYKIRKDGEAKLKQVAASLKQRYQDGDIRIFGYTDSTGDAAHNKQLAEERANAVKNWFQQNANIAEDHISIHPLGESQPLASNDTESGRQQNRSVQIVVRKR